MSASTPTHTLDIKTRVSMLSHTNARANEFAQGTLETEPISCRDNGRALRLWRNRGFLRATAL